MSAHSSLPSPTLRRLSLLGLALLTSLSATLGADLVPPIQAASPPPLTQAGIVLSFDDRNFDDWIAALPLLDQYGVKATFFISGAIDDKAVSTARQLIAHGHAIGAHGLHHLKAVEYAQQHSMEDYVLKEIQPQMEKWQAAGVTVTSFAYPSSRNDAATDLVLLKTFRHLRTGASMAPGELLSEKNAFFIPAAQVATQGSLSAKGIDYAPTGEDRTFEQIDAALTRAASRGEVIPLYAHGISRLGKGHHITPQALEHLFLKAQELKLEFYTFDQLPAPPVPALR